MLGQITAEEMEKIQADFHGALPTLLQHHPELRAKLKEDLRKVYLRPNEEEPETPAAILASLEAARRADEHTQRAIEAVLYNTASAYRKKVERALLSENSLRTIWTMELNVGTKNVPALFELYDEVEQGIPQYWDSYDFAKAPESMGTYSVVEVPYQGISDWKRLLQKNELQPAGFRELEAWTRQVAAVFGEREIPYDRTDCEEAPFCLGNRVVAAPGDIFMKRSLAVKILPRWSGYLRGRPRMQKLETVAADSIQAAILARHQ